MTTVRNVSQLMKASSFDVPKQVGSYIAGEWSMAGERHRAVAYPGTGEAVSEMVEAGPGTVAGAVEAARNAFENGPWPHMGASQRQAILRRAGALIAQNAEELAFLECLCAGLPISHLSRRQVPRAGENFAFFADYIGLMAGETFQQGDGYLTTVTRDPAGVAALVSPWNAPLALATMQVASCIAFGNTCVLKPSEHTPLAIGRMVALLEDAGVPAGVVNLVNGDGAITGDALVRHPGVDRIAFTGGTATARHIMSAAATQLTPVHFELGGKSANMVFADCDLERALDGSLVNIFSNNGQICIAGSRILVQRPIADAFIDAFVARARRLKVGDPMDPGTEAGPLAFEAHMERVLAYADIARDEGAEVLCGGQRDARFAQGWFIEPTVVRVHDNALRVCQEEVFGPFATIQVFDEPEEALAIANDSAYGLVAYAWTRDLSLAMTLQQKIRAGTLWINTPLLRDLRAPFGGYKQSGIGRDGPRQCAEFYTEEKATIVPHRELPIIKLGSD